MKYYIALFDEHDKEITAPSYKRIKINKKNFMYKNGIVKNFNEVCFPKSTEFWGDVLNCKLINSYGTILCSYFVGKRVSKDTTLTFREFDISMDSKLFKVEIYDEDFIDKLIQSKEDNKNV